MKTFMKKIWLILTKLRSKSSRWLIFLLLIAVLIVGATGNLESVKTYLDSKSISYQVGNFNVNIFNILRILFIS